MITIVSFIAILAAMFLAIRCKGDNFIKAYMVFVLSLFTISWMMARDIITLLLLLCLFIVLFIWLIIGTSD